MSQSIRTLALAACLIAPAVIAPAVPAEAQSVPRTREQVTLTFAPVVKQATPAVVNIYTKRTVQRRMPMLFDDPFFRQFFGRDFAQQFGGQPERIQNSLGSGVIVRPGGVVVTNNHVIEGADEITVVLSDRRELAAKLLGTDPQSDIAVLQIEDVGGPLPFLDPVDSDTIEVGDLVLAIGNPFGVGQTVTSGIVSALARTNVGVSDIGSFIQTDAAINPGNSGGALITSDGRLVGINTAIFSQSGGSIGIGFAVPTNLVRTVIAGILAEGRAVRPWLGASGQTVTSDLAKSLGLDRPGGVAIQRVVKGSPAASGGLARGDVILSINGKPVIDDNELKFMLATLPVRGTAEITVNRGGRESKVRVTLASAPDSPARDTTRLEGRQPFSGAIVANFNPALAEELRVEYIEGCVMILDVAQGSIAGRIGVQRGDCVVDLNGSSIATVEDLKTAVAAPANQWTLSLNRGGQILRTTVGG
ncbi:MAG: DegQ family serine endoprotease [Alphaproteobacteria bacterium]|nr:DegQ family serine endoprotease [Alphaproteobacteria bacterium]